MIEILNGIHETIDYGDSLGLKLFHNVENEDYPEHWHTGIEMIMPIIGDYIVCVGDVRYHLETGQVMMINTGVLHSLEAPPVGERVILQFDAALLYTLKEMETLLSLMPPVLHFTQEKEPLLYPYAHRKMETIIQEYDVRQTFYEARIYATLIDLFVLVGRVVTTREMEKNENQMRGQAIKQKEYLGVIMNVCNYINQHYQENLSLEETAGISGFSKFHFTRVFKQYMNMTFYEYLNSKRVKRAEELLYSTEMSITDVAMNSGFASLSAFNRTFKSVNGCSPSEFRNKVMQL
ncbi:MAG: AraC family transcriptional regulator [Lachnospiraceae bacterium]|nr:AraC family transcriptional regulator [Lachnospiraceae bacterium]